MPEITSVEAIRRKLQEFEERIDGAIEAAATIARVRTDAESLLSEITVLSVKSQQSLSDATAAIQQLQQTGQDFERLKIEAQATQAGLEQTSSRVANELNLAVRTITERLCEAEDHLRETTKESLSEQAELLKGLDESTRANADSAERAASLAGGRAKHLEELLNTIRGDLDARLSSELSSTDELIKSQLEILRIQTEDTVRSSMERLHAEFDRSAQTLVETAAGHGALIRQEIDSFKVDMTKSLSEQLQSMDRQITDFLNKQNALVQNLSQQIESYLGVSNALSAELATMRTQIEQFTSKFKADATGLSQRLTTQDKTLQALLQRIEEIEDKLAKKSWLPWRK